MSIFHKGSLTLLAFLCLHFSQPQQTQTQSADIPYSNRFSLVSGATQVLLGGANLEATLYTRRMSFDYSHGVSLEVSGTSLSAADQAQNLALRMPWTTGFGVGYRVTKFFDLRLEPKLHRFEVFSAEQNFSETPLTAYTTASLGLGMYYRYYPFHKWDNWLQGLVIVPNARFWPNIWSSLPDNQFSYTHESSGQTAIHRAAKQGIPGTGGFFMNVSVGYTFGGK